MFFGRLKHLRATSKGSDNVVVGRRFQEKLDTYYKPFCRTVVQELWKRRNLRKHKENIISTLRIIHNVIGSVLLFLRVSKCSVKFIGNWIRMLKELEEFFPKLKVTRVMWEFLPEGWVKHNMDGPPELT